MCRKSTGGSSCSRGTRAGCRALLRYYRTRDVTIGLMVEFFKPSYSNEGTIWKRKKKRIKNKPPHFSVFSVCRRSTGNSSCSHETRAGCWASLRYSLPYMWSLASWLSSSTPVTAMKAQTASCFRYYLVFCAIRHTMGNMCEFGRGAYNTNTHTSIRCTKIHTGREEREREKGNGGGDVMGGAVG